MCLQDEISKFVEKGSVPRLTSLDRKPRNKKALQKAFADKKPKVLGVMPADHKDLKAFQDVLVELTEMDDGKAHVRAACFTTCLGCSGLLWCKSLEYTG